MWSKWIEGDRMNILGPSCKIWTQKLDSKGFAFVVSILCNTVDSGYKANLIGCQCQAPVQMELCH